MAKTLKRKTVLLIRNNDRKAYGGGEIYQLMLAEGFRRHNFNPVIISSCRELKKRAKGRGYKTAAAWRLPMQNWSSWRNLLLPLYFLWQIILFLHYCWLFAWRRPLAVNIQSRDDQIAATLAAKLFHVRVIWTDHADFQSWVMQNVRCRFKNPIAKLILRLAPLADKIIFVSASDLQYFKELRPELKNLKYIANGVKDEYDSVRKKNAEDFCYLGRIDKAKGIGELLEAFERVRQEFPETKLHLYGGGDDMEKFRKKAGKNVIFYGFTDRPAQALAYSRYYVLPSYKEGLSLSLLQACMMERAIVATEVGGTSTVIRDHVNGLLIPPRDTEALAEAMLELLRNPEQSAKIAKAARETYSASYDFDEVFDRRVLPCFAR